MTLTITHSLSLASNSTRILPWVVLAGCEATTDRSTLEMLGASYILNASSEIKSWFVDDEKFHYLHVPIEDEPTCDVRAFFAPAHAFCDDIRTRHLAGERVGLVVHCKTGMSRSSTMLLAHMMMAKGIRLQVAQVTGRTDCLGTGCVMCRAVEAAGGPPASSTGCLGHGMTLRDALSFIRERRPRASPNAGFMAQLIELEGQLFNSAVTIDLERYRQDRFGDVRTFCVGDIDPVVGYTGLGAAAADSSSPAAPLTMRGAPKTPGSVKSGDSGGFSCGQVSASQQHPGFASLTRMPSSLLASAASFTGGTGMPPLILPVDLTPSEAGSSAGGGMGIGVTEVHSGIERPRRLSEQRTEPLLGLVAIPLPPSTTRPSSSRALRGFSYSYDDEAAGGTGAGSGASPGGTGLSPATPSAARNQFRAAHSSGGSNGGLLPASSLSGVRRSVRLTVTPASMEAAAAQLPSSSLNEDGASDPCAAAGTERLQIDRAMLLTPIQAGSAEPTSHGPGAMSDLPAPPSVSLPVLHERRLMSIDVPAALAGDAAAAALPAICGVPSTNALPGIAIGPTASRRRSIGSGAGQQPESYIPAVGSGSTSPVVFLPRPPLGSSSDAASGSCGAFAHVEALGGVRDGRSSSSARRLSAAGPLPGLQSSIAPV